MAKDKPGFQIYIVPDVFRFIHYFRHRQTYVNFLGDSEHLKLNVVEGVYFGWPQSQRSLSGESIKEIRRYVLKIIPFLHVHMSHDLLKCCLSK